MNRAARRRSAKALKEALDLAIAAQPAWTPFEEVRVDGYTYDSGETTWGNSRYLVYRREVPNRNYEAPPLIHLSIKRHDKLPIHDWRDLQRIKNELIGAEDEAVEIYPAESRLVDAANQYHLWSIKGMRIPFGFGDRLVVAQNTGNAVQRPLT
jgi:hypothetical protein